MNRAGYEIAMRHWRATAHERGGQIVPYQHQTEVCDFWREESERGRDTQRYTTRMTAFLGPPWQDTQ